MKIFRWSQNLESGIELIDKQHKKIFELANSLIIQEKFGSDAMNVPECLAFLGKYILYHFEAEEAFQSNYNYPKYRVHQAMHQVIATEFQFIMVKLTESNYNENEVTQFYQFFMTWIQNHILVEDTDFSTFFKQLPINRIPEIDPSQ